MRVKDYFIVNSNNTKTCQNALSNACISIGTFKPKTSSSTLLDHAEKCFRLCDEGKVRRWAFDMKKADALLLEWIVDNAVRNSYSY
jgi:hypothetical protein